jgi:hypothetical protein
MEEFGIDPRAVLHEINCLESPAATAETKPATEFKHPPLKGLWHKHFFSAHFIPENIVNGLKRGALEKLVDEIFDPNKSSVVTEAMTTELANRAVHEPLQSRADQGALTGEWIVFAKHNGQNYYLCLNTHEAGDQVIWDRIKDNCVRDFPFLDIFEPAPGDRADELAARCQPLWDAMQTPEAKAAAVTAFQASPEELGQAAVAAAAQTSPAGSIPAPKKPAT